MLEKLGNFIKQSDIVSDEIKLRIQNGNSNYKTAFGGLISIFSSMLIFASLIFFMEKFFNRKESTIISNEILTNDVIIENFTDLPFMIRISDNNAIVKPNSASFWKFFMSYWWTEKNLTDPIQGLYKRSESIQLSPCDINNPIHFNEKYRSLFSNLTDINTFFCPDYTKNMSLYGLYGDVDPYSYFHLSLRACINEIDNFICAPAAQLKSYMSNVYFDLFTVNYMIDSHSIIPFKNVINGERFLVSNSLYRRIWMNYKTVFYESDFGYIFEEKKTDKIFQIDNFSSDINLNLPSGIVPNTILGVTISNSKKTTIITRYFSKAQNFLANVGGIIKGISLIAYIVNYMVSTKLCNLYLINHLPEIKYLVSNGVEISKMASKKISYKEIKEMKKQILELNYRSIINNQAENMKELDYDNNNDVRHEVSKMKIVNTNMNDFNKSRDKINSEFLNLEDKYSKNHSFENKNVNTKLKSSENIVDIPNKISNHKSKYIIQENEEKVKLPAFEKYIETSLIKKNFEVELSWYHLILPDFFLSENSLMFKYYRKSLEYLMQEMDVANMINKLNQFEKFKQSCMTYDQLILFNFLFQSQNVNDQFNNLSIYRHQIDYTEFEKSFEEIKQKNKKDTLDEYLISILKE